MRTRLSLAFLDTARPAVRQLASVVGLVLALVVLVAIPELLVEPTLLMVAAAAILLAMAAAVVVPWERVSDRWVLVLPVVSLLAFGLLRTATGGTQSVFASLLLLPVIWIAAERGRIVILIAAVGTGIAMAMPYILQTQPWLATQGLRVLVTPIVFATVAGVVNELAAHGRRQVAVMAALAEERAATNEELRRVEAFNRSVWDAIRHQAVVITDMEGRIVEWGPGAERLLEMPRVEAVGRMATDFLQPADSERARGLEFETLLGLAEQDEIADGFEVRTGSGATVPVDITYDARRDAHGDAVGYILIAHDMRQAREAVRLKDEFVGSISHELRTPLSSVLGYLELARDDEAGLSEEQSKYLAVAERNARRLLALVGDLLFVAQVDAGRFPLELSRVDVRTIVAAAAETAMPHAASGGVSISVDLPDRPHEVRGDPTRIGQAIDNLVSNAIKFTPRGGAVALRLARVGDELCVSVSDTGLGIPKDEMERLFTRFFRSTTSTRQAVQGVGLGLNITRAIVEAHAGRIDASSVEGEGTTFEIWLPALD
ncbi:sensor histidine kinase [Agrococcus jejuensis]|uniref:sensor histidine kinase n=1 Tax=Agrococcus jejuensis TaxID=399736 RepID=UPI0011A0453F|nr:ATP-binding protein [Agrococcus jejuensis]